LPSGSRRCRSCRNRSSTSSSEAVHPPPPARSRWQGLALLDVGDRRREEVRFAHDSPLEGDGFELSVPRVMGGRFRTTGTSGDRGFQAGRHGGGVAARHQGVGSPSVIAQQHQRNCHGSCEKFQYRNSCFRRPHCLLRCQISVCKRGPRGARSPLLLPQAAVDLRRHHFRRAGAVDGLGRPFLDAVLTE
jgi:hypothetical protein